MEASSIIRTAMANVAQLHAAQASDPGLLFSVTALKSFQAARFEASYADLVAHPVFGAPTRFFLTELYSPKDFSDRDSQFSRIAGTIERLFPKGVVDTAVALAQVHELTETLDHQMALAMPHGLDCSISGATFVADSSAFDGDQRASFSKHYLAAWRSVGDRPTREKQLQQVLALGRQLDQLTRTRGLRALLKVMRAPASAAGLSALQRFLEAGFDTFSNMKGASDFLSEIERREAIFIQVLFSGSVCEWSNALQACAPIGASAGGLALTLSAK